MTDEPILMPELLLYNDDDTLTGGWDYTEEPVPGVSGQAMSFQAAIADIPLETTAEYNGLTFETYFLPNFNGSDDSLSRGLMTIFFANGKGYFKFMSHANGNFMAVFKKDDMYSSCNFNDSAILIKNEWIRFTFKWDATDPTNPFIKFYRNGIAEADIICSTNISSQNLAIGEHTMYLGDDGTIGKNPAQGWLDQVKILSEAAPDIEIQNGTYDQTKLLLDLELESPDDIKNLGGIVRKGLYKPPEVSSTLNINIPNEISKTLWLTLSIPSNQPAGTYQGILTLSEGGTTVGSVPLVVEVLPYSLTEPEQNFAIYYSHSFRPTDLDLDGFTNHMEDIKNHGFTGLIHPPLFDYTDTISLIDIMKAIGFEYPLVSTHSKLEAHLQPLIDAGYDPIFYGKDEPNSDEKMAEHLLKSYEIHQAGGESCCGHTHTNCRSPRRSH